MTSANDLPQPVVQKLSFFRPGFAGQSTTAEIETRKRAVASDEPEIVRIAKGPQTVDAQNDHLLQTSLL